MGCRNSRVTSNIDEQCNTRKRILLLGTHGSGKTTFIKQMRFIHDQKGCSSNIRQQYKQIINQQILQAIQSLIRTMETGRIAYSSTRNMGIAEEFKAIQLRQFTLNLSLARKIQVLWADSGIQGAYRRQSNINFIESNKYFFAEIERIALPNYIPTDDDILNCCVPTRRGMDHEFDLWDIQLSLIDTAHHNQDKNWLNSIQNVAAIFFFVALSDFDKFSADYSNGLEESRASYKTVFSIPALRKIPIVLIFNKTDLFEEKILHTHLNEYFPQYDGPEQEEEPAKEFISNMFLECKDQSKRTVYTHFVTAIDKENVALFFSYVKSTILSNNLHLFNPM